MLPTRLVIDDFFGFRHHEFDFTGIHVAVIVGKNGSGKSSIFDAFRWALYGRFRENSPDLVIRRRAARARVELAFTARGHMWKVIREKPRDKNGTLHLLTAREGGEWAEVTGHTMAETQTVINDLVGLSYAGLMAGPLMVQDDKRGDLMRLDPRERKNLIIEEADVEGYEPMFKDAESRQKEAAESARTLTIDLERLRADADLLPERAAASAAAQTTHAALLERQSLAHAQVTEARVLVATLEQKVAADDELRERVRSLTNALSQACEDVERHEANARRHQEATKRDIPEPEYEVVPDGALDALRVRAVEVAGAAVRRAGLAATKAAMRQEVAHVDEEGELDVPCHGEGIYASCQLLAGRVWSAERKAEFKERFTALSSEIAELDVVVAMEGDIVSDMRRLDAVVRENARKESAYRASLEANARAQDAAQTNYDEATMSLGRARNDVARLRGEIDQATAARADVTAARLQLVKERDNLTAAMQSYESAHAQVGPAAFAASSAAFLLSVSEDAAARIPEAEAAVNEAQTKSAQWGVLAAAFHRDGIPTMVIERLLPRIEARANEVLARMPEDMSVRLITSAVTKSGAVSDKLDIAVTHEGNETAFGMLSGAQQFRVNLALRLGQQRVLASRSGASIDFLFLDEADRDLDEEGVEALMETIAAISGEFGLVLLISHHTWLIDRVGARIDVSRARGETRAAVA